MGWGEVFALGAPMVWGLAVVLFRRSGESMPPFELNLLKNTLAFSLMLPTVLIWGGALPSFSGSEWALILLSGALGMALGDTLYFRAINLMGASRSGIIGSLLSPFVIILSAVFLGERLRGGQWIGFALVMAGILLVTWKSRRSEVPAAELKAGVIYGVLSVLLMAVGVIMVKRVLETESFTWVVIIRLFGGVAVMLVVATVKRQWHQLMATYRSPHPWSMTLSACVMGGYIASLLWLAGYKLIPASEASIYNEAQGSFIVFFAWLILGESIHARKLAGLALTIAGVITMLLV